MPVFLLLLILLAFPVLEIWLLIELAGHYGWWLLVYLVVVAVLGFRLIKDEQMMMFGRMAQTLSQGGPPGKALFGSAKNMIAGILLIIPGVITDAIAVVLLLIPSAKAMPSPQQAKARKAANDDVIEGEFRRED